MIICWLLAAELAEDGFQVAAEAEVYSKIISGGQKQLRLGIWQRFIPSLLVGDRSSSGWSFGRGLFQVY